MQRTYHFKTQKHNFNKTTNQILTYPPDFSVKYSSSTTPTKAVTNNSIATHEKLIEHQNLLECNGQYSFMSKFGAERSEIEQLNGSSDKFVLREIIDKDIKSASVSPARNQIKGRKSVTPSHADNIELKKQQFEQKQFQFKQSYSYATSTASYRLKSTTVAKKSIKAQKPVMLDLYKKAKVAEMKDVTSKNKVGHLTMSNGDQTQSELSRGKFQTIQTASRQIDYVDFQRAKTPVGIQTKFDFRSSSKKPSTPNAQSKLVIEESSVKRVKYQASQQKQPQQQDALNEVFKVITLSTMEEIARLKKPSKSVLEAGRLLCLFLNQFRDDDNKWPKESFSSWVTVHHYLIGSPNTIRILKELQGLKKLFLRPFQTKMDLDFCRDLMQLKQEFLEPYQNNLTMWLKQIGNKTMKQIVNLVFTCLNQITQSDCATWPIQIVKQQESVTRKASSELKFKRHNSANLNVSKLTSRNANSIKDRTGRQSVRNKQQTQRSKLEMSTKTQSVMPYETGLVHHNTQVIENCLHSNMNQNEIIYSPEVMTAPFLPAASEFSSVETMKISHFANEFNSQFIGIPIPIPQVYSANATKHPKLLKFNNEEDNNPPVNCSNESIKTKTIQSSYSAQQNLNNQKPEKNQKQLESNSIKKFQPPLPPTRNFTTKNMIKTPSVVQVQPNTILQASFDDQETIQIEVANQKTQLQKQNSSAKKVDDKENIEEIDNSKQSSTQFSPNKLRFCMVEQQEDRIRRHKDIIEHERFLSEICVSKSIDPTTIEKFRTIGQNQSGSKWQQKHPFDNLILQIQRDLAM